MSRFMKKQLKLIYICCKKYYLSNDLISLLKNDVTKQLKRSRFGRVNTCSLML